jgi:hypothetical protein
VFGGRGDGGIGVAEVDGRGDEEDIFEGVLVEVSFAFSCSLV